MRQRRRTVGEVVPGSEGLWLSGELERQPSNSSQPLFVWVTNDAPDQIAAQASVHLFCPEVVHHTFPAWDVLPYDSASPDPAVLAQRAATLWALRQPITQPTVCWCTVNAVLQRTRLIDPDATVRVSALIDVVGGPVGLSARLGQLGYRRTNVVRLPGEMSLRGGVLDVFPAGSDSPLRIDFFGDTIETMRWFNVQTQMGSISEEGSVTIVPAHEMISDSGSVDRFAEAYIACFGVTARHDQIVRDVVAGVHRHGQEHFWTLTLPSQERLEGPISLLQQVQQDVRLVWGGEVESRIVQRHQAINEAYADRLSRVTRSYSDQLIYRPLPPSDLYVMAQQWQEACSRVSTVRINAGSVDGFAEDQSDENLGARALPPLWQLRSRDEMTDNDPSAPVPGSPFSWLIDQIKKRRSTVVINLWSQRLISFVTNLLRREGLDFVTDSEHWPKRSSRRLYAAMIVNHPNLRGFAHPDVLVVSETDLVGTVSRKTRRRRGTSDVVALDLASLRQNDLVVHVDYGVGRFEALDSVEIGGYTVDCLRLTYADGDSVVLPAINAELLSRYGSDSSQADGARTDHLLDKLGAATWQKRKARAKDRIDALADQLIAVEAQRKLTRVPPIDPSVGSFEEFCMRFVFMETEDQLAAIDDVIKDLEQPYPMDRIICGDAGFGKTEIAMRAAFLVASSGRQVAMIAPTTLLAQQHAANFSTRFESFDIEVAELSRMVPRFEQQRRKERLASGATQVVVGTHSLLSSRITFHQLGLIIIDEEQHFGVAQKEKLKTQFANVGVLTLTATPIPRTLHMALSGVRSLSMISTPPVDRTAVRTYVQPFDEHVMGQAIMRELKREGQVFVVCPRIAHLQKLRDSVLRYVPSERIEMAHGQMSSVDLDRSVRRFVSGEVDVLIATPIVESGLDIPRANTMIVWRPDHFGLSQLYQLRGRVGRSNKQAWCYFFTSTEHAMTSTALRRLKALQSLDGLSVGFQVASHDLDIRGAGNLLGAEQSGQIREVGVELFQAMLSSAVERRKNSQNGSPEAPDTPHSHDDDFAQPFSPVVNLGVSAYIPDTYVPDLDTRMDLYRRLSEGHADERFLSDLGAELRDRFGVLPEPTAQLLRVSAIKHLAKICSITRVSLLNDQKTGRQSQGDRVWRLAVNARRWSDPSVVINIVGSGRFPARLIADGILLATPKDDTSARRIDSLQHFLTTLAHALHPASRRRVGESDP